MSKNNAQKNLGGLYIFAVLTLASAIFLSWGTLKSIILPFNFDERWISISTINMSTYNAPWMKFVIFNLVQNIVIAFFTITVFVLFIKQSKHFSKALLLYFFARLLLLTFVYYFQTIIKGPATPSLDEIIAAAVRSLILPGIWIPYILLSEKSAETFVN